MPPDLLDKPLARVSHYFDGVHHRALCGAEPDLDPRTTYGHDEPPHQPCLVCLHMLYAVGADA